MRRRGRARAAGLLLSPILAFWAVAGAAGGARASGSAEQLFRASATATAVHGFYDHQGLFPVPIGNLDVPQSEVTLEPGPATTAMGSFLWDPQAAELGTIFCELSNGQACGLPNYPFVAQATYPPSGKHAEPPALDVSDPRSPVEVRGADEHATALATRAGADASVAGLAAIPMTASQRAAARRLSLAIRAVRAVRLASGGVGGGIPGLPSASPSPSSGGGGTTTRWLVEIDAATSSSTLTTGSGFASASASSEVHGLSLLGGTVTLRSATGDASASQGRVPGGRAAARWAGLSVGGYAATVGPDGIQIQDRRLGGPQLRQLQDAVNGALSRAGLSLSRGSHTARRQGEAVVAESWALSIDYAHQNVPSSAPQGAGGQDVLQIPVGYAWASAERASFRAPPTFPAPSLGPVPVPPGGQGVPPAPPGGTGVGPGGGGVGGAPNAGLGPPPPKHAGNSRVGSRRTSRFLPVVGTLDHGIPARSVVLLALAGVAFVVGMTGLKTMESLTEGIRR